MSSDKVYLSKEEQAFLIHMLETKTAKEGAEKFATLMIEERANPSEIQFYLKETLKKYLKKFASNP
jgi:hypothetical protein